MHMHTHTHMHTHIHTRIHMHIHMHIHHMHIHMHSQMHTPQVRGQLRRLMPQKALLPGRHGGTVGEGEGERLRSWLTPPPLGAAPPALRRLMGNLPAALGGLGLGAGLSVAAAPPLVERVVTVPDGVLPGQKIQLEVGGMTQALTLTLPPTQTLPLTLTLIRTLTRWAASRSRPRCRPA